ncbi:hypothetical protein ACI65C_006179 [Semiaphis heraclei]
MEFKFSGKKKNTIDNHGKHSTRYNTKTVTPTNNKYMFKEYSVRLDPPIIMDRLKKYARKLSETIEEPTFGLNQRYPKRRKIEHKQVDIFKSKSQYIGPFDMDYLTGKSNNISCEIKFKGTINNIKCKKTQILFSKLNPETVLDFIKQPSVNKITKLLDLIYTESFYKYLETSNLTSFEKREQSIELEKYLFELCYRKFCELWLHKTPRVSLISSKQIKRFIRTLLKHTRCRTTISNMSLKKLILYNGRITGYPKKPLVLLCINIICSFFNTISKKTFRMIRMGHVKKGNRKSYNNNIISIKLYHKGTTKRKNFLEIIDEYKQIVNADRLSFNQVADIKHAYEGILEPGQCIDKADLEKCANENYDFNRLQDGTKINHTDTIISEDRNTSNNDDFDFDDVDETPKFLINCYIPTFKFDSYTDNDKIQAYTPIKELLSPNYFVSKRDNHSVETTEDNLRKGIINCSEQDRTAIVNQDIEISVDNIEVTTKCSEAKSSANHDSKDDKLPEHTIKCVKEVQSRNNVVHKDENLKTTENNSKNESIEAIEKEVHIQCTSSEDNNIENKTTTHSSREGKPLISCSEQDRTAIVNQDMEISVDNIEVTTKCSEAKSSANHDSKDDKLPEHTIKCVKEVQSRNNVVHKDENLKTTENNSKNESIEAIEKEVHIQCTSSEDNNIENETPTHSSREVKTFINCSEQDRTAIVNQDMEISVDNIEVTTKCSEAKSSANHDSKDDKLPEHTIKCVKEVQSRNNVIHKDKNVKTTENNSKNESIEAIEKEVHIQCTSSEDNNIENETTTHSSREVKTFINCSEQDRTAIVNQDMEISVDNIEVTTKCSEAKSSANHDSKDDKLPEHTIKCVKEVQSRNNVIHKDKNVKTTENNSKNESIEAIEKEVHIQCTSSEDNNIENETTTHSSREVKPFINCSEQDRTAIVNQYTDISTGDVQGTIATTSLFQNKLLSHPIKSTSLAKRILSIIIYSDMDLRKINWKLCPPSMRAMLHQIIMYFGSFKKALCDKLNLDRPSLKEKNICDRIDIEKLLKSIQIETCIPQKCFTFTEVENFLTWPLGKIIDNKIIDNQIIDYKIISQMSPTIIILFRFVKNIMSKFYGKVKALLHKSGMKTVLNKESLFNSLSYAQIRKDVFSTMLSLKHGPSSVNNNEIKVWQVQPYVQTDPMDTNNIDMSLVTSNKSTPNELNVLNNITIDNLDTQFSKFKTDIILKLINSIYNKSKTSGSFKNIKSFDENKPFDNAFIDDLIDAELRRYNTKNFNKNCPSNDAINHILQFEKNIIYEILDLPYEFLLDKNSDDNSGDNSDDNTNDNSEDISDDNSGDNSDDSSNDNSGDNSGYNLGDNSGYNLESVSNPPLLLDEFIYNGTSDGNFSSGFDEEKSLEELLSEISVNSEHENIFNFDFENLPDNMEYENSMNIDFPCGFDNAGFLEPPEY